MTGGTGTAMLIYDARPGGKIAGRRMTVCTWGRIGCLADISPGYIRNIMVPRRAMNMAVKVS